MTMTGTSDSDETLRDRLPVDGNTVMISLVRLVAQFDPESVGHSVKRPPVDAEHIRRPCPVAPDRLQHMCEVAALHLVERGQIFKEASGVSRRDALQRQREVVGATTEPRLKRTIRSMVFSSCRTLPGQSYACRRSRAPEESATCRPARAQSF